MSHYMKKDSNIEIGTPPLNPKQIFWESALTSPALDPIQLQKSPLSVCDDYKETMSPLILSSSSDFLKSLKNNYQTCNFNQNKYIDVKMTNNIESIIKKLNSSNETDDIIKNCYHLYNASKNILDSQNFAICNDIKIDTYIKNCVIIASFLSLCNNFRNYLDKTNTKEYHLIEEMILLINNDYCNEPVEDFKLIPKYITNLNKVGSVGIAEFKYYLDNQNEQYNLHEEMFKYSNFIFDNYNNNFKNDYYNEIYNSRFEQNKRLFNHLMNNNDLSEETLEIILD